MKPGLLAMVVVIGAAGLVGLWVQPRAGVVLSALALGGGFGLLRACSLATAGRVCGLRVGVPGAWRLFVEGSLVEVMSWPGKVWADAYRVAGLGRPRAGAMTALLLWRASSTAGSLGVLAALGGRAAMGRAGNTTLAVAMLVVGLVLLSLRDRRLVPRVGAVAALTPLGAAGTLCDVAGATVLAWGLIGVDPLWFAEAYIALASAAAASTLPLGVGPLDLGLWALLVLYSGASPREAAGVVAAYRLTGPITTLGMGVVSMTLRSRLVGKSDKSSQSAHMARGACGPKPVLSPAPPKYDKTVS
ncbi:MAG: hypothetical protein IT431_04425 [Phycisphaerales bacterium]|nr:hypothetical protein [Phycisphaerales bacterium]